MHEGAFIRTELQILRGEKAKICVERTSLYDVSSDLVERQKYSELIQMATLLKAGGKACCLGEGRHVLIVTMRIREHILGQPLLNAFHCTTLVCTREVTEVVV